MIDNSINAYIQLIKDVSNQNSKDINHDSQKVKNNLTKNYYK